MQLFSNIPVAGNCRKKFWCGRKIFSTAVQKKVCGREIFLLPYMGSAVLEKSLYCIKENLCSGEIFLYCCVGVLVW